MKTFKQFKSDIETPKSKEWKYISKDQSLVGAIPSNYENDVPEDEYSSEYLKSIGKAKSGEAEKKWNKIMKNPKTVGSVPSNYPTNPNFRITD